MILGRAAHGHVVCRDVSCRDMFFWHARRIGSGRGDLNRAPSTASKPSSTASQGSQRSGPSQCDETHLVSMASVACHITPNSEGARLFRKHACSHADILKKYAADV